MLSWASSGKGVACVFGPVMGSRVSRGIGCFWSTERGSDDGCDLWLQSFASCGTDYGRRCLATVTKSCLNLGGVVVEVS